jgi:hypothetical protein
MEGDFMKVYVLESGIVFSGKSWEIIQRLKQLQGEYIFVNDWISDIHERQVVPPLKGSSEIFE